ncbi:MULTISPECIES: LysR substrate-binding domain-containing protein [unclassified Pseudonocardia]|uniref:LysR substrate-binding domain-containing protein n=1 Tax=unclassified Pseudonocardia TaxID=2619320 RepID=UPI0001FFECB9|nr:MULTISPECIES: LysR substrate-binding domain-containing protein [unclassified Pseudonocardia]ALE73359.1 LysR family transcriptional regulator [Pseudonocardia sp. EC080625-04]ALL76698.1 LysR family transcriptional regulator [Pseudonocardia sp. EC080610-09]ALL83726.1 LysR family transcriptional regulator [Pseudonocardia sp. EC080619-01]OLM18912.1 LysR-family transcriptional regulator [Pseudonocardia sp. Ae707_Ps1]
MLNPYRLRMLTLLDGLGTVRAVAETMHVSPSTVSQQLGVLESETRSGLLERTGRRVRLTPAGLVLARRGREILDRMADAEAELRALHDEPIGNVRLGVFQSAIHTLAVPAAERLAASHPHLHVELVESEPHESGPALGTGELDVVVTTTDHVAFPWDRDLEIVPLGTDPVVLVLPPDHPLTRHRVVDLAACATETWALDRPGSYMAELTARLCHESGFEPRTACRFGNYLLLLQHVEAGRSVALLPALAVAPGHAVVTRGLTTPVHRNVAVVRRRASGLRTAVDAVVEALLDHPELAALSAPGPP